MCSYLGDEEDDITLNEEEPPVAGLSLLVIQGSGESFFSSLPG
jgi:hypothetical protein